MAKRFFITKDLDVLEFSVTGDWGYPKHKHNFFELTFIIKGRGEHKFNESTIEYKEGDLFFLTPEDEHEFVINEPTTFGLIKFTEQIFIEKTSLTPKNLWRKRLDDVIYYKNIIPQSIVNCPEDRKQLFHLYQLIKCEIENAFSYNREVQMELFGALLIVISRNLKPPSAGILDNSSISNTDKIEAILAYVRRNVLNKDKIRIKTIADEFFLSPNYVSVLIKKHAGISIQQYVIQTKIQMAKRLLKQKNLSVGEVATKTGFVDASHFNRIFKKYIGKNPSDYALY